MAVKIRLARRGRKKLAKFDIIVAHGRSPRDGVYIEKIGTYDPLTNPATVDIKAERALDWLMKGAQPTETVRTMLSNTGLLYKKHLQVGIQKGAITQEEADKRFNTWKSDKDSKISSRIDKVTAEKEAGKKARLDREVKVNESKAAALKAKLVAKAKAEEKAEEKAAAPTPEPVTQVVEPAAESVSAPVAVEVPVTPVVEEPQAEQVKDGEAEKPVTE